MLPALSFKERREFQAIAQNGVLEKMHTFLVERLKQYEACFYDNGEVSIGDAKLSDNAIYSLLRRDIEAQCFEVSQKVVKFIVYTALWRLKKHFMMELGK